jgi:streptogramin lyase
MEAGPQGGGGGGNDEGGVSGNGGMAGTNGPDAGGAGGNGGDGGEGGEGGDAGEGGEGGEGGTAGDGGVDMADADADVVGDGDSDGGFDASDGEVEAGTPPFDPGPPGTLIEFPMPALEGSAPVTLGEMRIAVGVDDKLYITDSDLDVVFRMDVEGNFEEFPLAPSAQPRGITLGPDGNVWFTEFGVDKLARITPDGDIDEFPLPTIPAGTRNPHHLALGPDGNLWFTEQAASGNAIGRLNFDSDGGVVTPLGVTEFALPNATSYPRDITAGPDGNLWFTEQGGLRIGRITTGGFINASTEYTGFTGVPLGIAPGPDGNVWFSTQSDKVAQITPAGTITEYDVDTAGCVPLVMALGPDDALWYSCYGKSMLGRTDPNDPSNPSSHTLIAIDSEPSGIVFGPGEAVWFVQEAARQVGYLVPP